MAAEGKQVEREGATTNRQTILGSGFQDGEMEMKVVGLTKEKLLLEW